MSEEKKTETSSEQELSSDQLEQVAGGAETVHLYLKSNSEDIQGELTQKVSKVKTSLG